MEKNVQYLKFYFARHGETEANSLGIRCGGDSDSCLTPCGYAQAAVLGQFLLDKQICIHRIVTSPLRRTRDTAIIVAGFLNCSILEREEWKERAMGNWNGRPIVENEKRILAGECPPGGESEELFQTRVKFAVKNMRDIIKRSSREAILVIASRGVGRILHVLLTNKNGVVVKNGGVIEVRLFFFRSLHSQEGVSARVEVIDLQDENRFETLFQTAPDWLPIPDWFSLA
ncbi:hypothetical protein CCP2SC5_430013 [Azospirillaceae bacterium]